MPVDSSRSLRTTFSAALRSIQTDFRNCGPWLRGYWSALRHRGRGAPLRPRSRSQQQQGVPGPYLAPLAVRAWELGVPAQPDGDEHAAAAREGDDIGPGLDRLVGAAERLG